MKEKLLNLEASVASIPQKIRVFFNNAMQEIYIAIDKLKNLSETNYRLGLYHMDKGNIRDAKMRFSFVLKLKPDFAPAHYHLARCHLFNLDFDKAKTELNLALSLDPNLKVAEYRLNLVNHTIGGNEDIPTQVIREDYNSLAQNYEDYMINRLKYNAPETLVKAIEKYLTNIDKDNINALDLGCGTGLVGAFIRSEVAIKSLIGIDISANMLDLAKELVIDGESVYNMTKEHDFYDLKQITGKLNLITACMSLGYVHDLQKIFAEIELLIDKKSILGLVVLKSTDHDIMFDYNYACFSFSEKYLKTIFQKFNWHIEEQDEIDVFANKVKGLMFILSK